jgi:RNA polymerase sigma-70 factor (ECF subfamily)
MTTPSSCVSWNIAEVRRLCLREARRVLSGDPALAEDAAQEASIRIWRSADSCLSPDAPEPWMRSIAHREALRALSERRECVLHDAGGEPVSPSTIDRGHLAVREAVRRLPEPYRMVLSMRYWDDLSQAEIAKRLGMPEGTAKVRLHRARRALQRQLEDTA